MHMTVQGAMEAHQTGRSMRLDTLVRLRWFAVIGQTTAVLVVYLGLDYDLKIWACLAVIALAAWLNVALRIRFPMTQRLEPDRAAWLLGFDIAELAVLLFFTGGLQNPFAILFLAPVMISATALPPRHTLALGLLAAGLATLLTVLHWPLPWTGTDRPLLPPQYQAGNWIAGRSWALSRHSAGATSRSACPRTMTASTPGSPAPSTRSSTSTSSSSASSSG